jgi:acetoin utilization deacetylase AcuC-like enzyme
LPVAIGDYGIRVASGVLLMHPSSLEHDTGAHPERAARIVAIERTLEANGWLGYERVEAPAVAVEQLETVHTPEHVESIRRLVERGGGMVDADTVTSPGSWEAALHSAGGASALVDSLLEGSFGVGFSATRPPGHHAERDRAMGFCLFDNVAIAARRALDAHGVERVLIVDWDVHHGNGTNDIFHATPEVLFVSIHQWPLYPGTGAASDVGSGEGEGYTVNLPVPGGSGDETYASLVEHVVVPLASEYQPGLVLVSAGFDAHRDDPLADCRVTETGYAAMTRSVRAVADSLDVPVGVVLEGGYDLNALASSVAVMLEELSADAGRPAVEVGRHPLAAEALGRLSRWFPALAA